MQPRSILAAVSWAALFGLARPGIAGAAQNYVVEWGVRSSNTPPDLTNVAVVAGGSVALKRDGTLRAWGISQTNPPASATNVIAIAIGDSPIALRRDGTAINWSGQVWSSNAVAIAAAYSYGVGALRRDGTLDWKGSISVPPIRSNIVSLIGGGYATLGVLYSDGTVWSGLSLPQSLLATLTNVVSMARRGTQVWLKSDGTAVSSYGTPKYFTNIVAVAAGNSFALALRKTGTVAAWGNDPSQIDIPTGLSNVVAIAAGDYHCLALRSDGTVVAWGGNTYGQTNIPAGLTNVSSIFAHGSVSVAIVGDSPPTLLAQMPDVTTWVGRPATFTVQAVGSYPLRFQWQFNGEVIEGATNFFYRIERTTLADFGVYSVLVSNVRGTASSESLLRVRDNPSFITQPTNQIRLYGDNATFSISAIGSQTVSYQWFFNGQPIAGATQSGLVLTNISAGDVGQYWVTVSNAFGVITSVVVTLTPLVIAAWGSDGPYDLNRVPGNLLSIAAIATGPGNSTVIKPDGTATSWGNSSSGATVDPNVSNLVAIAYGFNYPIGLREDGSLVTPGGPLPSDLTNAVAVSVGWEHSLALSADGSVAAWGQNTYGQTSIPAGLRDVVGIAAGGYFSLALRADGSILVWGYNGAGQTNVPAGLTHVVAIAAGGSHSIALHDDGTVVAWGSNFSGQTTVPADLSNVIAIAAGADHSLALCANGKVVAWGDNQYNQSSVPPFLRNVVAIAASGHHSLALLGEGLSAPTPRILNSHRRNGRFSAQIETLRGRTYYMQQRTSLTDTNWMLMSPVPGDNSIRTLSDPATTSPQGFYRVWQKPGL